MKSLNFTRQLPKNISRCQHLSASRARFLGTLDHMTGMVDQIPGIALLAYQGFDPLADSKFLQSLTRSCGAAFGGSWRVTSYYYATRPEAVSGFGGRAATTSVGRRDGAKEANPLSGRRVDGWSGQEFSPRRWTRQNRGDMGRVPMRNTGKNMPFICHRSVV
jgi:hypothetical protein